MSLAQRTTLLEFVDPGLKQSITVGLDAVERRLHDVVDRGDPFLTEAASHLFKAGGKRFRPMLAFMGAQFGESSAKEVVEAALVVELTHLATLYHDDVMDEALVRRGAPSANSRWGNSMAILVGDYLFAIASEIVASLGTDVVHTQATTFARLVHGQIAETVGPPAGETDPIAWYLHVLAEKTGSLIATAARLGSQLANAPADVVEAVAEFGEVIGVAFQLSDDLLDISSDGSTSGKTQGTDLMEGIRTLPVLFAQTYDDTAERLRELLAGPVPKEDLEETLQLLRESPAMDRAYEVLDSYGERAKTIALRLPEGSARDAFIDICDYIVARSS